MANRRYIDFPIASTSGDTDIILIWQDGANKQTTKATFLSGLPENLEDLNDVVISGLTNGQILRYDSVTGKWENTDQGNLDLNDLNDVSIVSPSNGQVLVYNSSTSKWENSSGGFVPYVGAVTTVDLGAQGLRAGYVRFDTTVAGVPNEQGLMFWDADDETVDIILNGYTMKIGEDLFYPVKNQTGSTIAKGVAVRFNGTVGASGRLLIAPFIADGSVPSSRFMGVTAEEILNGEDGKVLYFGRIRGINTNAFNEGDILYASTTVAGGYQTAIPLPPNNIVQVAAVVTKSATVGTIFVRPTLGSNINTDEGVKITSVADKNLLQYQSGTSLWENKSLAQVLGGTSAQFVKGDGSLDSSTYGTGTVTSVGLSSATSGVTIGSSPVTTSGTITLAIATANGSQNGLLSSTDWTTFNNKQNALTNPVTGTGASGQVAYFTGTSAISSESNLFWDATNDRIGIGTATPLAKLHIEGSGSTYTNPESSNVPGIYIYNTNSSSTNANTFLSLVTSGAGGGDPILSWDIDGVIGWSAGIDNSDGDSFKIANSWLALDSTTRFEINGSGRLRLNAYGSGTFTGTATRNLAVDSLGNIIEVIDGGGTVTGTGTTNYLSKFTGTSSIGNSNIFDNGTNVGIGTATNTTALVEIFGSALQNSTNPALRLSSSNTGQTVLVINNTSSKGYELSVSGSATGTFSGSFYIYDIASQVSRFVVSSGGNILVNTTTDSGFRLDVNGTARFLTNSNGFVARFTGGATGGVLGGFFANSTAGFASIGVQSNHEFRIFTNDIDRLTINASTGAATFSSTVKATSTGVDGVFSDAFIAQFSSNNAETNSIQTAVSSAANQSGFRFQASNGGGSSAKTTIVDFLRDRQIFYGNVGINQINPTSRLSVSGDAANIEGLVNINNTKSGGGVYFPALKVRNVEGNHSYGIVSEFSTGSTGGDRASILFYSNASNHSWTIGQITSSWGVSDSFGIGYRANNSPSTFNSWPTNYFAITTNGNVLIGTTTNGSSKLKINGLPTSSSGLASGDVWNDGGTLKIA